MSQYIDTAWKEFQLKVKTTRPLTNDEHNLLFAAFMGGMSAGVKTLLSRIPRAVNGDDETYDKEVDVFIYELEAVLESLSSPNKTLH